MQVYVATCLCRPRGWAKETFVWPVGASAFFLLASVQSLWTYPLSGTSALVQDGPPDRVFHGALFATGRYSGGFNHDGVGVVVSSPDLDTWPRVRQFFGEAGLFFGALGVRCTCGLGRWSLKFRGWCFVGAGRGGVMSFGVFPDSGFSHSTSPVHVQAWWATSSSMRLDPLCLSRVDLRGDPSSPLMGLMSGLLLLVVSQ